MRVGGIFLYTLEGKPNTQKIMNVEFNLLMNLSWWSASVIWQGLECLFPLTKRTQVLRPQTFIMCKDGVVILNFPKTATL